MADKPVWVQVREAYMRKEGSLRQLAERFGISQSALEHKCRREGWRKQIAIIGGKVEEIVVNDMAKEMKQRMMRMVGGFEGDVDRIDKCYKQMDDVVDPDMLYTLMRSRKIAVESFQQLGALPIIESDPHKSSLSTADVMSILTKVGQMTNDQRAQVKELPDMRTIDIDVEE